MASLLRLVRRRDHRQAEFGIASRISTTPRRASDWKSAGYDVAAPNTPDDFARFIRADTERWLGIVEKANISVK